MNLGMLYGEIKRVALENGCKKVEMLSKIGGEPPTPSEFRHKLRELGAV